MEIVTLYVDEMNVFLLTCFIRFITTYCKSLFHCKARMEEKTCMQCVDSIYKEELPKVPKSNLYSTFYTKMTKKDPP